MTKPKAEQMFQSLNAGIIDSYDRAAQTWHEKTIHMQSSRESQGYELLRRAKVDVAALERSSTKSAANLRRRLVPIRQQFVDRAPVKLRKPFAVASALPLHAATLVAPEMSFIESNIGKRGNPWLMPRDPSKVDVVVKDSGKGLGWGSSGAQLDTTVIFWFGPFMHNVTAMWEFAAAVALHGFYIAIADDGVLTHKVVSLYVKAQLTVYQYSPMSSPISTLLSVSGSNVDAFEFFDQTDFVGATVPLKRADPAWCSLKIILNAVADGGGSYAEVNLSQGEANYIEPLLVAVAPR